MFTWILRFHFAFLLLIFGELVGWQEASTYNLQDWTLVFLIYLATASLLLDLIARWHINDIKTLLMIAGLFGLIEGMLISLAPREADNIGVGLIFRPMGLEVLMFLLAFWSFRQIHSGEATGFFAFLLMALVGTAWGIWVRWFPQLEFEHIPSPELDESLPYVVGMLFLAGFIPVLLKLRPMQSENWELNVYEFASAFGILGVTLLLRLNDGYIPLLALAIVVLVVVFICGMLYFTRNDRQNSLLDGVTPPKRTFVLGWLIILFPFAALAWLSYEISDVNETPFQADALFTLITAFGVLWLPIVSTWLGYIGMVDLFREGYA